MLAVRAGIPLFFLPPAAATPAPDSKGMIAADPLQWLAIIFIFSTTMTALCAGS
jgi:hypothetical protein